jgi:hypothetical protein
MLSACRLRRRDSSTSPDGHDLGRFFRLPTPRPDHVRAVPSGIPATDGPIARSRTTGSVFAERLTTEDVAARAVRWLLRGGTWEGLANELAREAVRSSGVELSCLAWLADLIEARLVPQIDGLVSVLEPARASARAEHLREWPHDHGGADAVASLAADERAKEEVSRIYLGTLQWAADLIDDRLGSRSRSLRPLQALRHARPGAELEVPALVADGLTRHPRYGWPTRANPRGTIDVSALVTLPQRSNWDEV